MAAGIVIIQEAGGLVGRLEEGELLSPGTLVAGNQGIYPQLTELLLSAGSSSVG
jgi:fructose-1,6-bisphosphatase/inositol monophosphatase family enzyme